MDVSSQHAVARGDDGASGLGLAQLAGPPLGRPPARLPLGLGCLGQRRDLAGQGAGALLVGAQGQPGLGLGAASGGRRLGELLEQGRVGLLLGGGLGLAQTLLELGETRAVGGHRLLRLRDRGRQTISLAAGGARRGAQVPEVLGDGGHRGV
jgi:hypothetical protein